MDVMRPQFAWIGNKCYRKLPLKDMKLSNPEDEELEDRSTRSRSRSRSKSKESGMASSFTYCDEACDSTLDIQETSKGFRLTMELPKAYYKYIIGKKGETRKRLEIETHTQILIPKPGDTQEIIVINSHDRRGIVSAKTRIDVLVDSARQRQQFTHFLSIPVTADEVIMGFEDFRFEVLSNCDGDRGLSASLFQNPQKLHLTIGTLVLLSDREIHKAVSLLQSCKGEIIDPVLRGERLEVLIKGLEYMNDDPAAVDILYAKVEAGVACDRLQMIADRLVDKFSGAGLIQQEHECVKLHVTVMNTLMRKDPSGTSVPKPELIVKEATRSRESFDATSILKKYKDFNFGSQQISSIQLSQRYSSGTGGYYECAAQVMLPN